MIKCNLSRFFCSHEFTQSKYGPTNFKIKTSPLHYQFLQIFIV